VAKSILDEWMSSLDVLWLFCLHHPCIH
jgi:hypothetical protein